MGGQSVAYYDTTTGNSSGAYRDDDVDIRTCSDTGGGYAVSSIASGEWLNYTINVAQMGSYVINTRYSSTSTGYVHFLLDGNTLTGSVTLSSSGSHSTWKTVAAPACTLPAGQHVLRLCFDRL